ncbi:MAG: energy-coupled thiamine transporter ThiT [Lachnospiraceae bacterium]|nr:energy-coupled thiamine transporter ThiT [Lachnospiraceae bacterium]
MKSTTERLAVTAMMLAASTLLSSVIKLLDLPYGGSVTLASALPVMVVSFRYGTPWGLLTGLAHGLIQLVLGRNTLSYVTGAASVAAVIILDYLLAFTFYGLAGVFRKMKSQPAAFVLGAFVVSVLRYISHVISGCTVWAGLSIPTEAALQYSLIYNATYMLPEMLILIVVSYYISSALDLQSAELRPLKTSETGLVPRILAYIAGALVAAAAIFDIVSIFSKTQDAETGEFYAQALVEIPWILMLVVTLVLSAAAAALLIVRHRIRETQKEAA